MKSVSLRKVTDTDAMFLVHWRNANRQFFPPQPALTLHAHAAWYFRTYLRDPSDHFFMVLADGAPVGTISFNSRTREIGRVMLGNKRYARQGVMSRALRLIMEAFPGSYCWLKVLEGNDSAIAFYQRNGLRVTGPPLDGFTYMEARNDDPPVSSVSI